MNLQNPTTKRNVLIAVASIGVLVLFIASIVATTQNSSRIAKQQPVGEESISSDPAYIAKGEDVYSNIGAVRYEALRKDLTNYARNHIKTTDRDVNYEIGGNLKTSGDSVTFTAIFLGSPAHKIDVSVKKLPYDRQKLSFINTKTKTADFDNKLSSNNARNNFIATLPNTADLYTIDFDTKSETIVVYLGEHSLAARNAADIALKQALGDDISSGVSYLVPGLGAN